MGKPSTPKDAPPERPWTVTLDTSARYRLDKVSVPVLLILGSAAQCLLSLALPASWATVPLASCLFISLLGFLLNRSLGAVPRNVIPGRLTVQLPRADSSPDSRGTAAEVVVFHVGAQFNHPLGNRCPGAKEMGEYFNAMVADIERRRDELGLLGLNVWTATIDGSLTTLATIYCRDEESLRRFAHEDLHRRAWDLFSARRFPHIGVYHETFIVPKDYDCLFINCKPMLLGAATSRARGESTVGGLDKLGRQKEHTYGRRSEQFY
ncbi:hypothetical protein G3M48_007194 [Beauveria asiatica]|uniref:Monooxygenase n=1 Tax=Beauveria asiatica TaxID=1069075 RepID=A0AAW0RN46_9HYPO